MALKRCDIQTECVLLQGFICLLTLLLFKHLNETCFEIFFDAVHLAVELILQKGVHLMVLPAPIFIVTANA